MNKKKRGPENFDEALEAAQEELKAQEEAKLQGEADGAVPKDAQDAQAPDPRDKAIEELKSNLEALSEENRALREAISEQSRAMEAQVIEETIKPDESAVTGALSDKSADDGEKEYARRIADQTRDMVLKELSPYLESTKRGAADVERLEALQGLSQLPEFADILGMRGRLDHIIRTNPIFANSDAPIEDKLITAFAFIKGRDAIQNPKSFTADDFIKMYNETPELRKRIEMLRLERAGKDAAALPPLSASSGASSAPLSPPQSKPRDFEEAKKSMLARLGLN